MLSVTMLQTPRVELDGTEIVFPTKRVDALLYYMLVRRSATRQELIALLWESCDTVTGLKNLRNTVYLLKKALGGDFLLSPNKSTLQVNPAWEITSDYDRFMRDEELHLYQGEFLQGFAVKQTFSFDLWMRRMRDTLRERYLLLISREARRAAEQGRGEDSIHWASDYLREEPYDEEMVIFLMNRCACTRNYPRAAEAYQQLRDKLQEDLGTEPQQQTTQVYYRIMDEWNHSAESRSEAVELSGDALLAAQLLSIFRGSASSAQLTALAEDKSDSLLRGLKRLGELKLARRELGGEDGLWHFLDEERLVYLYDSLSLSERQRLHRHAAHILLTSRRTPTGSLLREVARQYRLAGDSRQSLTCQIRGLELSSSRCCAPSPVLGADSAFLPDFNWAEELGHCSRLLEQERSTESSAELEHLTQLLTISRGRIALFYGNWELGRDLLGELTGYGTGRDPELLLRACIALAANCIDRQKPDLAERYVTAGERLAVGQKDEIWWAIFLRLRGMCFYLKGKYDRALYYLSEVSDILERLPESSAVRLQASAVHSAYGCVMLSTGDYAQASHSFRLAIRELSGGPWVEEVWLYVHYGRTAFLMEDHSRARQLFHDALSSAHATGSIWGRGAAAAYLAYYSALDEHYSQAAEYLNEAAEAVLQSDSALEKGIISYVSMLLRSKLDAEGRRDTALEQQLTVSAESYVRQGLRHFTGLCGCFEAAELSRCLREGVLTKNRYRAIELYSRERHFMSE